MAFSNSALETAFVLLTICISSPVLAEQANKGNLRGMPSRHEEGETAKHHQLSPHKDTLMPSNRIVGGLEAVEGRYPWFAYWFYRSVDGSERAWGCGGSLIAPDFILTAAHCISTVYPLDFFGLWLGRDCIDEGCGNEAQNYESHSIDRFWIHPDYDRKKGRNDVAIVQLSSMSATNPIRLDTGTVPLVPLSKLHAIGFGATEWNGAAYSDRLREVELQYIPNEICDDNYNYLYGPSSITTDMMCATDDITDTKKDSCQGDSGGPLFATQMTDDGTTFDVQVGVTSWGYRCAADGFPGVYARVSAARAWLDPIVCVESAAPVEEFCRTSAPTRDPTASPELSQPTESPTTYPSEMTTSRSSDAPSSSGGPTLEATLEPSEGPTLEPSHQPSDFPTVKPSFEPSGGPSLEPSYQPSGAPTFKLTSVAPSTFPTVKSTVVPSSSCVDTDGTFLTHRNRVRDCTWLKTRKRQMRFHCGKWFDADTVCCATCAAYLASVAAEDV